MLMGKIVAHKLERDSDPSTSCHESGDVGGNGNIQLKLQIVLGYKIDLDGLANGEASELRDLWIHECKMCARGLLGDLVQDRFY